MNIVDLFGLKGLVKGFLQRWLSKCIINCIFGECQQLLRSQICCQTKLAHVKFHPPWTTTFFDYKNETQEDNLSMSRLGLYPLDKH